MRAGSYDCRIARVAAHDATDAIGIPDVLGHDVSGPPAPQDTGIAHEGAEAPRLAQGLDVLSPDEALVADG